MADIEEIGDANSPEDSQPWLDMIEKGKKSLQSWNDKCDNIEKLFASLERLAGNARDREFQMFWANCQVLGPSIYSKSPIPVVIPKFKDRSPLKREAAEMLERACIIAMDDEGLNDIMKEVRDDLIIVARGKQAWVRLDDDSKACIDLLERKDFVHSPARTWREVDFVARCAWLKIDDFKKRFPKVDTTKLVLKKFEASGDLDTYFKDVQRVPVWELWCKSLNTVVWVTEGHEQVLDKDKPHLELEGFFPCPRPAFGTLERGSLIPVPDFMFCKDQYEELNEVTGRIHALTDALRLQGFYPAGAGEISDAIETALKKADNRAILIPISDWALMGGQNAKDMIVWLPLDQVATVVQGLIALRKELQEDIRQILGIADIMRGVTDPNETLGAQQLKSQYGSVRIRDKQDELVRYARDVISITAEVMAETYSPEQFLEMSQMNLPRAADIQQQAFGIQQQIAAIELELKSAQSNPEILAKAQQAPEIAQQVMQEAQQQLQGLQERLQQLAQVVTVDQVIQLYRDQNVRGFTLDIETDSTIAPDENAQKQRATEYITSMTGLLSNAMPAVQAMPQAAPLMADVIRFANSQFRVGRTIEQSVEEFTDQMKELAKQPKTDPAVEKAMKDAEGLQQKLQAEMQTLNAKTRADLQMKDADNARAEDIHRRTLEAKQQEHDFKMQEMAANKETREREMSARAQEFDWKMAENESRRSDAKQASELAQNEGMARAGIPIDYSFKDDREQFKAIMGEIAASRETTSQVLAVVGQGQQDIAEGLKQLAAVNAAPVKITSPEGRVFTKQPMVN